MERKPCNTNRIFKNRRILDRTTEKLGESYEVNKRSPKEYEKAIW